MKWANIGDQVCSVSRALSVVGDKWTLLIVRSAFLGARKFTDFQTDIGVTRHRLSDRLSKLVEDEVLIKVAYQDNPVRYDYRLSPKGKELYPVIMSLVKWGDKWMADHHGPPMEYLHKTCGHQIMPHLTCPDCEAPIDPHDMRARPGPALRQARLKGS